MGLAEATLDALADQVLVGAAWDDVRAAFEGNEFAGICELRIKQLAELVDLRGSDWRSTASRVRRVLFDDRPTLAEIGAIDPSCLDEADPQRRPNRPVLPLTSDCSWRAPNSRPSRRWARWLRLKYTIRLDETLNSSGELVTDLSEGSLQRRVAAELAHHAGSAGTWLELLNVLRRRFDILLARLVRQRNSVLHGADTVPAVVSSVAGFALQLQSFIIHQQLRAATIGEPLLTALERNRIRLERVCMRLDAGESPAMAIFERATPLNVP